VNSRASEGGAAPSHFFAGYIMDALQHRLTQYKGSPGQGSTVKSALNVHHAEIKSLIALVGALQAQVAELRHGVVRLETALQPEPEPEAEPLTVARAELPEACPVLAVAAVVAPVVAAVVLPAVAAALSSKPAEDGAAGPTPRGSTGGTPVAQVVGHYSVTATPASSGNDLPTPVAVQAMEEGSETDSVEAILLEAEQHSADRFMSLAKHQQATTAKVRAAAARKRAATPRKSKATP
jgi:hypothetical protein